MKNINLSLLFLLLLALGCKKNINDSMVVEPPPPPVIGSNYNPIEIPINSSVVGMIIDENGQPVEGATISLNNQTQTSDRFGSFRFMDIMMNENGTFLKIQKDGYFESGRRFYPKSAATHHVRVQLLEKVFDQSFAAATGGTMTFGNGGEIVFSSESIKNEDGEIYSGEVKVAVKWLDPTADFTLEQMPGDLLGVTIQGEEMALETYGMIAVELESPIGEPLNITQNKTAQIKMPIPPSLQTNAPNEIPLWAFNYQFGVWAEDGKATLENGFYVGVVDHFSFWNCDFGRPAANLTLTLINEVTKEPLPNFEVKLTIKNSGLTSNGFTNADGEVSGKVPKGEDLEMQVLNLCDEVIYSQDFNVSIDNLELSMEINRGNSVVISGEIIDCNGASATDGLLLVEVDGKLLNIIIEINPFEVTIPICQNASEIKVSGANLTDKQQGGYFTFPITDSVSVGDLLACGNNLVGFGLLTIDSSKSKLLPITIMGSGQEFYLSWVDNSLARILITFPDTGAGNYSDTHSNLQFEVEELELLVKEKFEFAQILEYGANSGDLVSGEVSGYVENVNGGGSETVHVSFKFAVNRD